MVPPHMGNLYFSCFSLFLAISLLAGSVPQLAGTRPFPISCKALLAGSEALPLLETVIVSNRAAALSLPGKH